MYIVLVQVLHGALMAYVFGAFQLCPRPENTAASACSRNGAVGRLADASSGLEVREDVPQRNT